MDRRDFLKISGAAAASAGLAACAPKTSTAASESKQSLGPDHMEQHFPGIGLLGFGCMRWPSSEDGVIDQQAVNEMVDYALAHGVNYYDSAPVYLRGQSERATAIALLRHPRESYIIATKCSNFRGPWSFEQGRDLYLKSFENFETDYIDYYLLHSLSGYASFKMRFEDTGLIDYFVREREAGRIRHLGFSFHGPAEGFDEMMALHDKYHWDFVQIQMNYSDWTHAKRDVNAIHMYEKLTELGIPIVLMEPLLGGRLATQPAAITDMLKAERPDKSVASWAFRFVGSFPQIMCVLSGMTRMEHLKDNLETYLDFEPLRKIYEGTVPARKEPTMLNVDTPTEVPVEGDIREDVRDVLIRRLADAGVSEDSFESWLIGTGRLAEGGTVADLSGSAARSMLDHIDVLLKQLKGE